MRQVTIDEMHAASSADEELWHEYLFDLDPDHKQFLPYAKWLSLKVAALTAELATLREQVK